MVSMAAPRKYPDELRERAIRMAVDARRDPPLHRGVEADRGAARHQPRNTAQLGRPGGDRCRRPPGTSTDDAGPLAELEKGSA